MKIDQSYFSWSYLHYYYNNDIVPLMLSFHNNIILVLLILIHVGQLITLLLNVIWSVSLQDNIWESSQFQHCQYLRFCQLIYNQRLKSSGMWHSAVWFKGTALPDNKYHILENGTFHIHHYENLKPHVS